MLSQNKSSAPRLSFWFALYLLPLAAGASNLGKLGAMGDSLTDEYWDDSVSTYATNWLELLVHYRGVNAGPTAAQAGVGSWGSPRETGFKYNWALGGATTASLLTEGQHTGLSNQVGSEGISSAVLAIGPNDFNPGSSAYMNIYNGSWSPAQVQSYVSQSMTNIETALSTVRATGVAFALATVIDPGLTPVAAGAYPIASERDRVAAAIQSLNVGVKFLAQKYQVPLMDWSGLATATLGSNTNLRGTLKVGNVTINMRGADPGPPNSAPTNAFVSDSFHPNTLVQGIFANLVMQTFNSGYNTGLTLFSEQELLNNAEIAYGGSDTLQSQIGSYTNFVVLPVLPRFTSIHAAGSDIALKFTTVSNQLYLIESRDDLALSSWTAVSNNIPSTGAIVTLTNHVPAGLTKRFYRVRQLP
jgi:hypothetical protein